MSNKLKRFESCDIADQRGVGGNSTFCLINSCSAYLETDVFFTYQDHNDSLLHFKFLLQSYEARQPTVKATTGTKLNPCSQQNCPLFAHLFFSIFCYIIYYIYYNISIYNALCS